MTLRLDFSDATPTSDTGAAIGSVAAQVLPESGPRTSEGTVCNDIDFNNDELYVDLDDFFALLSRYAEGPCLPLGTTCDAIDFNNDGSLFDPCDIDSLLLVFSEGPCTACGV